MLFAPSPSGPNLAHKLIDCETDECIAGLKEPLGGPEPIVVIDLGGLARIDTSGTKALLTLKDEADNQGRRVLLASVSPGIKSQFTKAGVGGRIDLLEGRNGQPHCDVCNGVLPTGVRVCLHCGIAL